MGTWDDFHKDFEEKKKLFEEEFERETSLSNKIFTIVFVFVILFFIGLCVCGCFGSYFGIRQLRQFGERNRGRQVIPPPSSFPSNIHVTTFNPVNLSTVHPKL